MATGLDRLYGCIARPLSLLNSIFMSTVNMAAKMLVSVASSSKAENTEKWKLTDHLRFMVMLITWLMLWALRFLMDLFPCSLSSSPDYLLGGSSSAGQFQVAPYSSSAGAEALSSSGSSLDLILRSTIDVDSLGRRRWGQHHNTAIVKKHLVLKKKTGNQKKCEGKVNTETSHSNKGHHATYLFSLVRLRNIWSWHAELHKHRCTSAVEVLALLNEIPASSRKYQFTMAMADKIMEDNARHGHWALLHVNRTALASSFTRTSTLLHRCLQLQTSPLGGYGDSWHMRAFNAIPLSSYVASYVKAAAMCFNAVFSLFDTATVRYWGRDCNRDREIMTEKLAQELLWVTNKLGCYGGVNEALVQWSLASGLATLSLTANPRVQGSIVKISAFLIGELTRKDLGIARHVKFRLLVLCIPLFCHASNGHSQTLQLEELIPTCSVSLALSSSESLPVNRRLEFGRPER
ncbi:hypothetical protein V6N12_060460 [Hibiscus sabdariffa]|uniref:Uncharacterized protein n=1 Tax=Hibiscus sabdariffa TaxID=183260 RepID=A0ABR2D4K1_9ROSI